jgi:hypothetical protein
LMGLHNRIEHVPLASSLGFAPHVTELVRGESYPLAS